MSVAAFWNWNFAFALVHWFFQGAHRFFVGFHRFVHGFHCFLFNDVYRCLDGFHIFPRLLIFSLWLSLIVPWFWYFSFRWFWTIFPWCSSMCPSMCPLLFFISSSYNVYFVPWCFTCFSGFHQFIDVHGLFDGLHRFYQFV